jgi:serine/threonine-protein kinase
MSETVLLSQGIPASIREGELLAGKYRLEQEIGRGAMGTVWSAVHLTLGQRVAIKLIAAEHAQSPEARVRFSIEAKAAARLRSRYVVQVYDDGETAAGTPYIVLEYLDGETLEQRLERERDVPLNDAVRVTRHVARALARAHAQGIIHRDLKPGNVFLTRADEDEVGFTAKVLDFGIAKLEEHGVTSTTKTGTLLGTPLFMSPEQVRGASTVDSRSDLYSLGMVFYNMLTGDYAFNGDGFADVLVAICTLPLPDLRANAPWIPESVANWFAKACAREPGARFQTADEMIEALDLALGVSSGAYSRAQTDLKLDTLRGHSPPIAHGVPRTAPATASATGKGSTQVIVTDPTLLGSNHVTASRTLAEASPPTASRTVLAAAAGAFLIFLVGGSAYLFVRHKSVAAPSASAEPRAAATSTPATTATTNNAAPPDPTPSSAPSATSPIEPGTPQPIQPSAAPLNAAGREKSAAAAHPVKAQTSPAPRPQTAEKSAANARSTASAKAPNTTTDIGF